MNNRNTNDTITAMRATYAMWPALYFGAWYLADSLSIIDMFIGIEMIGL